MSPYYTNELIRELIDGFLLEEYYAREMGKVEIVEYKQQP